MTDLKTDLERVRAAVGGPMPMKTMRAYLAASDDAFRFLRTHGEALAGLVRDAERLDWLDSQRGDDVRHDSEGAPCLVGHYWGVEGQCHDIRTAIDNCDQAMQESRDE